MKRIRRCQEEREDFDYKDGAIWPIRIFEGGELYSFCPGKATWPGEANTLFNIAIVAAETGQLYKAGGISEQPQWFLDLLRWFLPRYDQMKFISKADMILGGESKPKSNPQSRGRR